MKIDLTEQEATLALTIMRLGVKYAADGPQGDDCIQSYAHLRAKFMAAMEAQKAPATQMPPMPARLPEAPED